MPVPCVLPGSSLLGVAYVRPLRARVVFAGLPPRGLLLLPFPWSGLVGLASPGGFGSGRSAPGAPLPGRWGSPLFVCASFPPFLAFLFCLLVRVKARVGLRFVPNSCWGLAQALVFQEARK